MSPPPDKPPDRYVSALGYGLLTPLYDALMRFTMPERRFKQALVRQAGIQEGHRVLDLGCGTATLTLLVKHWHPGAEVHGLDGDAKILELAEAKAVRAGLQIRLRQSMASQLPYEDGSFDRVLCSLLFHHLSRQDKLLALRETYRLLRPGGELHVADWGKAQNSLLRGAFLLVQMLDGFANTADHARGLLPELARGAGFQRVRETAHYATVFGSLRLFRAVKPA